MKSAPHTFITIHGTINCYNYKFEKLPGHDYELVTLFDRFGKKIFKKMYTCEVLSVIFNGF